MKVINIDNKQKSYFAEVWAEFCRNKTALIGGIVLIFEILLTVLGPFFYTTSPTLIDFSNTLAYPSTAHPFGTNMLGQDMLARIMLGGRISLVVGIISMVISVLLGTIIGMLSGYYAGKTIDIILMRITDLFLSIPGLPLLMIILYFFKSTFRNLFGPTSGIFIIIIVVISLISWMSVARLVRASFLSVREMDYVKAIRAIGAKNSVIITKHILPNVMNPIIVAATFSVGNAILTESTISFLGLGFPPDIPTWGSMLNEAQNYLPIASHIVIIPAFFIFLTVLCVNALGDGIRDALDPQQHTV